MPSFQLLDLRSEFQANVSVNMPELCIYDRYSASLSHVLPNQHRIRMNAQYIHCRLSPEPREYLAYLSYDIPFGLAIPKSDCTGCVCGHVFDQETHEPLEKTIVSLAGDRTLTDEDGFFRFPNACEGSHLLTIDRLRPGYVPWHLKPIAVTVRTDKCCRIALPAIRSAVIEGRLIRYDIQDHLDAAERYYLRQSNSIEHCLFDAGRIEGVHIILTHAETKLEYSRTLTRQGGFSFGALRPGTWTIDIASDEIPSTHQPEQTTTTVTVKSEQQITVNFRAYPWRGQCIKYAPKE